MTNRVVGHWLKHLRQSRHHPELATTFQRTAGFNHRLALSENLIDESCGVHVLGDLIDVGNDVKFLSGVRPDDGISVRVFNECGTVIAVHRLRLDGVVAPCNLYRRHGIHQIIHPRSKPVPRFVTDEHHHGLTVRCICDFVWHICLRLIWVSVVAFVLRV